MRYHISFSGGLGSAVTALAAHKAGLEFTLLFADTLIEDEDLYRFIEDVAKAVDVPITYLRDGRDPWEVFVDRKYIGNTRTAHCSTELKTKPIQNWLAENAAMDEPLVLGMDWSESDRLERASHRWHPRPVISLLNELNVWRPQYDNILAEYDITKPRLYDLGFTHNNCGGFCVKAGKKQFALLRDVFPDRYKYHAAKMDDAMKAIGETARPFLRHRRNNETAYLTLNEYDNVLNTEADIQDEFDLSGCGCFTD